MSINNHLIEEGDKPNEQPGQYRLRILRGLPDQIGDLDIGYQYTDGPFGYTFFTSNKNEGTISQYMNLPGKQTGDFKICLLNELYSKDKNQKFYDVSASLKDDAKEVLNRRIQYLLINESGDRLFLHIKFESGVSYFHQIDNDESSVSIRFSLPVQTAEDFESIVKPLNILIYEAMKSGNFDIVRSFISEYELDENIITDLHIIQGISSRIELQDKQTVFEIHTDSRGISIELNWGVLENTKRVIKNAESRRPLISFVVRPFFL